MRAIDRERVVRRHNATVTAPHPEHVLTVGNGDFARAVTGMGPAILNTDDHTVLEYRFARGVGRGGEIVDCDGLRALAILGRHAAPPWTGIERADHDRVAMQGAAMRVQAKDAPPVPPAPGALHDRVLAMRAFADHDHATVYALSKRSGAMPADLTELAVVALAMGEHADPGALPMIEELRTDRPVEADFLRARYEAARGDLPAATASFEAACRGFRSDPWVWGELAHELVPLAGEIARRGDPGLRARLFQARSARWPRPRGPLGRTGPEDQGRLLRPPRGPAARERAAGPATFPRRPASRAHPGADGRPVSAPAPAATPMTRVPRSGPATLRRVDRQEGA